MTCKADGCTERAVYVTAQLCKRHYMRRRSRGDENAPVKFTRGWTVAEKLAHYRIVPDDLTACFGWSGKITKYGYAALWLGGRAGTEQLAHRVAFEEECGFLSDQLQVDHMCHNEDLMCSGGQSCLHRRCTNPRHLRAVTRLENMRAAQLAKRPGYVNANARKTHCPRGHEYTEENTEIYDYKGKKSRLCRECRRVKYHEKRRARNRAA